VLPENFAFMGAKDTDKLEVAENDAETDAGTDAAAGGAGGPIQAFLAATAARHALWLVGGGMPMRASHAGKVRNTLLAYDDSGRRVARYDKIHLFGFDNGSERYVESATVEPGAAPLAVDTPLGRVALSICYDVRFPELYRALGPVDMILVPSAFTVPTGRAHWETLLRARAIENLAYVIAPAQGGTHAGGRRTWGDSLIVDPWGEVLARQAGGEGVVSAPVDPVRIRSLRGSLPALEHRTL